VILAGRRINDCMGVLQGDTGQVDVHDPSVGAAETRHECWLTPIGVRAFGRPEASLVYDVKDVLPRAAADGRP
jgi:hypothetical protein